jgi:hypothetical protein
MRPWLVLVGTAFLVIGGSALVALVLFPPPSVTQELTSQDSGVPTLPNSTETFVLASTQVPHGTLTVHWSSSAPVAVQLLVRGCGRPSAQCSTVLESWAANSSGSFTTSGPLQSSYALTWTTPPKVSANLSVASSVTWVVHPAVSLGQLVAEVASGLLAAVGGIALFLGVFLRGDYRRPLPPVSRHADDAEGVADATGPRTEPSDGGSGSRPPRPPARSR